MKEKRQLNKYAWFMFGGACGVLLLSLINMVFGLNIWPFIVALVAAGLSVLGLFYNKKPARDGIFSAIFLLHILTVILMFLGWSFIFAIITLIVAVVFDVLYEGLSNSKCNKDGTKKDGSDNFNNSSVSYSSAKSDEEILAEQNAKIAQLQKDLKELEK